jgi:serine/threonine protein kinase
MNDARWQRLSSLLDELFDLEPAPRERRLADLGAEDPALATELRRLLAADDASGLLDAGVVRAAPTVMSQLSEPTATTPPAEAGKRVGHYRLVERVGSGGMGEVWRGERVDDFEQQVAVKLIRPLLDSPQLRDRFARERRILARLDHPNIARLLDGGVAEDGTPWYAMEFVRGTGIVEHAERVALDTRARVHLLLQVCDAVAHAHGQLVVHRDLKPSNILVDAEGRARVLDFGIARLIDEGGDMRLTGTGVRVFSPAYAAPEQIRGEAVGTAADVFALGSVLYELLTGSVPHPGRSAAPDRLIAALEHETAPRPSNAARTTGGAATTGARTTRNPREYTGDLDTIVATALQPDPARRYAGAAQLADDLRRWLDGRPIAAQPDTAGYRMRKFVTRHRIAVGSASAVLLALIAGLGIALWQASVAQDQARRADAEAARATTEAQRAEREAEQARTQTERTRKVKEFFIQTLAQADPMQRADAGPTTVAEALDAAIERAETELASDPVLQADVFDDFGELRAGQGRFDDALALLGRALAVAEKEYGPDHPVVAETLNNLAAVHNFRGDEVAGAEPLERALRILERDDGGDPVLHANAWNTLAAVRQQQGDSKGMREAMQRAEEIYRARAPDHPQFVTVLTNLAMIAQGEGRAAEAERGFREVIDRIESQMGLQSPHLWPSLFSLIDIAYDRGDTDEELALARRSLEVARHNFPDDHPWKASSLNELGWILAREGEFDEGEPLMREGIAMQERLGSTGVISARRRLAIALHDAGREQESDAEMERAWATCVEREQQANQICATLRANRATMLALRGKGELALGEAEAARAAIAALDSELPSERGQADQAKAFALAALGRHEEALALQDQVIADYAAAFGPEHGETEGARSARKRLESLR